MKQVFVVVHQYDTDILDMSVLDSERVALQQAARLARRSAKANHETLQDFWQDRCEPKRGDYQRDALRVAMIPMRVRSKPRTVRTIDPDFFKWSMQPTSE